MIPSARVRSSGRNHDHAGGGGTALLLATVVGSGIMGERLAGGNLAVALLVLAIAKKRGKMVKTSAGGLSAGRPEIRGGH